MINLLRVTIILLICIVSTTTYSQKKRVIGFDEDDANEEVEEYVYKTSAIKIAPLNFINGNFPIFYEKELSNFGIQVGAGPTFKRYFDIYSEIDYLSNLSVSNFLDPDANNSYSFDIDNYTANVGLYGTLELKYYYSEDGFDGRYFGFKGTYYKYNMTYNFLPENASQDGSSFDEFKTLTFIYGAQIAKENVIYESFFGVGLNWMTRERYAFNNQGLGLNEGSVTHNATPIAVEFGFRVGFQL